MSVKFIRLTILPPLLVAVAGCKSAPTGTNLSMQRMDESRDAPRSHLAYMVDNAILHDMSVADLHFVPHSAELNGTGVARLDRMAKLVDVYGGTVRYETALTDQFLISQRIENVREYLSVTGCDMGRVDVRAMISGGRGMPADEAIKIMEQGTRPATGPTGAMGAGFGAAARP